MTLLHAMIIVCQLVLNTQPDPVAERVNLTTTIGGQEYTAAIIINPNATKGGSAILFLHGYGECGTNNQKQLTVGLPKHMRQHPEQWPYVLIAPQKPVFNSDWEEHEQAVLYFLDEAAKRGLFDPDRLAITGLSQGGHGTIVLASTHPDRFVAAAPVCGYLRPIFDEERQRINHPAATPDTPAYIEAAHKLSAMPIWFWHGNDDQVVPASESRSLHRALLELDADSQYTELPGVNHNSWDDAYTSQKLSNWFNEHLSE